jgi:hypothetical protein
LDPRTCQSYSLTRAAALGEVGVELEIAVGSDEGSRGGAEDGPWTWTGIVMDESFSLSVCVGKAVDAAAAAVPLSCTGDIQPAISGSGSQEFPPSPAIATVFSFISTNSCFNRFSFADFNSEDCSLCLSLARTFLILAVEASPPLVMFYMKSLIFWIVGACVRTHNA